jgi:hypothetical protein
MPFLRNRPQVAPDKTELIKPRSGTLKLLLRSQNQSQKSLSAVGAVNMKTVTARASNGNSLIVNPSPTESVGGIVTSFGVNQLIRQFEVSEFEKNLQKF